MAAGLPALKPQAQSPSTISTTCSSASREDGVRRHAPHFRNGAATVPAGGGEAERDLGEQLSRLALRNEELFQKVRFGSGGEEGRQFLHVSQRAEPSRQQAPGARRASPGPQLQVFARKQELPRLDGLEEDLLAEVRRLRSEVAMSLEVSADSAETRRLRSENAALREACALAESRRASAEEALGVNLDSWTFVVREKERLADELAGAQAQVASLAETMSRARAEADELRAERDGLLSTVELLPAEVRLRAVMGKRGAAVGELRREIRASETLVDEARWEDEKDQLRARRAAFKRLIGAVERVDEAAIEGALAEARNANVDAEDLERAERRLKELRSLPPPARWAPRAAPILEPEADAQRKKEAYLLVKQDDDAGIQTLLEGLEAGVRWQDWRDYAGRTVWRCALELRAARVLQYLAPKLGLVVPSDHLRESQ